VPTTNTVEFILRLAAGKFRRDAQDARKAFGGAVNGVRADSKKLKASFKTLDIRPIRDINREIRRVRLAYGKLAASSRTSARDINRANRAMRERVRELRKEARGTAGAFSGLGGKISLVAAGIALLAGLHNLDAIAALETRVRTATKASGDFETVWKAIGDTSIQTGAKLETTVSVFQGLARSGPELGATNTQMLTLTKTVQQLGVISGASTVAMQAGLLQFSQGLASGVFRAEEFNSLLENLPEVAVRIAKGLGVSVGELRKMVLQGKLASSDVFQSLIKQAGQIDAEFRKIPPTITRASVALKGRLGRAISDLDRQIGATRFLASLIQRTASFLGELGDGLNALEARRAVAARELSILNQVKVSFTQSRRDELLKEIDALDAEIITLNKASANALVKGEQAAIQRSIDEAGLKLVKQRQALAEAGAAREIKLRKKVLSETLADARTAINSKRAEINAMIAEEARGAARIKALRQSIADIQATALERVRDLQRGNLTESERQASVEAEAVDQIQRARQALAAGQGADAERLAGRIDSLAGRLTDVDKASALILESSKIQIGAKQREITVEQQASAARKAAIAQSQKELTEAQGLTDKLTSALKALGDVDPRIEIQDNIDAELARIDKLKAALASAQGFVTLRDRNAPAAGLARGGRLPGYGGGDRIPAVLEAGEFIVRKEAVAAYGPSLFAALNAMRVQMRAAGGHVPRMPYFPEPARLAAGGPATAAPGDTVHLQIDMGNRRASLFGARDQVRTLVDALTEVSRGG